ncbi:hypothetical protein JOF56_001323 [Kibdelosporangium banguiense]|uniref:Uncharacterized protein n=1 Tax=Kibdelosporangium banguiense TaxID=1365924 RepID=A0ABS4T963_9PSEU|nr:hypothetical protein [Kibdelosporangium banguiense]MBP2320938.1 hypothetical protein [Kibdelosporangium banguiense]
MKSRLVSGIVGALLALGLTAAPAVAETTSQESSYYKGKTVVTVDPGAVTAFGFFNIRVDALRPASGASPAYTFPVQRNRHGVTELAGGLQFTANDKCLAAYAPVVNTKTGVVKAWVSSGGKIDLFSLNGQSLVLTDAGAKALNDGLGFTGLFSVGFVFGTYATTGV